MFPKPKKTKRRQAKRRHEENKVYQQRRAVHLIRFPTCVVCEVNASTEVHHSAGRVKDLLTDPAYFFAVCRSCHEYIHANPAWAYEQGFLLEKNKVTPPT